MTNLIKKTFVILRIVIKKILITTKRVLRLGSYPDYIIIGAQKCGTTALQKYLTEHPNVSKPRRKEIHYFDDYFTKSIYWYKANFPINKKVVGEASPSYIFDPKIPKRIKKNIPNVKLIVLLRNPVERAFSHYKMNLRKYYENRTFSDIINNDLNKLNKAQINYSIFDIRNKRYSYLERGLYYYQLTKFFKYFDKNDILIIDSNKLNKNTINEVSRVFKFLNLPDYEIKSPKKYHIDKNKNITIKKEEKYLLTNFYKKHNKLLFDFLKKDFDW